MYGEVVILLGNGGNVRHSSVGNKAEETVYLYLQRTNVCVYLHIFVYLCLYTDICNQVRTVTQHYEDCVQLNVMSMMYGVWRSHISP